MKAKRKMTKKELSTLMIDKITFITTDEKGRETIWRTTSDVDHSYLCDGWDIENFEEEQANGEVHKKARMYEKRYIKWRKGR